MTAPTCNKCAAIMEPGIAIAPTLKPGALDFPSDKQAMTFSEGGPGRVVPAWKCPECGRSMTMREPTDA